MKALDFKMPPHLWGAAMDELAIENVRRRFHQRTDPDYEPESVSEFWADEGADMDISTCVGVMAQAEYDLIETNDDWFLVYDGKFDSPEEA
jgi:hypothetical protein